ncbi:MAG UNVERIFIED_CONTAM: hypothetical protein LVR29_13645 [Microcystis novacekii LVE1205-3]|jgi:hypothetical protein
MVPFGAPFHPIDTSSITREMASPTLTCTLPVVGNGTAYNCPLTIPGIDVTPVKTRWFHSQ